MFDSWSINYLLSSHVTDNAASQLLDMCLCEALHSMIVSYSFVVSCSVIGSLVYHDALTITATKHMQDLGLYYFTVVKQNISKSFLHAVVIFGRFRTTLSQFRESRRWLWSITQSTCIKRTTDSDADVFSAHLFCCRACVSRPAAGPGVTTSSLCH